jgi:hypothetical protein
MIETEVNWLSGVRGHRRGIPVCCRTRIYMPWSAKSRASSSSTAPIRQIRRRHPPVGERFRGQGLAVLETGLPFGAGIGRFAPAVRALLKDKLDDTRKGQSGAQRARLWRAERGKSNFINRVAKKKSAKVSERPCYERQAVVCGQGLELLDTRAFSGRNLTTRDGPALAFTGAVMDTCSTSKRSPFGS